MIVIGCSAATLPSRLVWGPAATLRACWLGGGAAREPSVIHRHAQARWTQGRSRVMRRHRFLQTLALTTLLAVMALSPALAAASTATPPVAASGLSPFSPYCNGALQSGDVYVNSEV